MSSWIEGAQTNLSELLLDEVGAGEGDASEEADRLEVRNYIRAMEAGIFELGRGRPITLNLVKKLHAILMTGVRGRLKSPGEFCTVQNWIGSPTIENAIYVPPPYEFLVECLDNWERFVNAHDVMPDLIQCAILHEQFEAIHPFKDGNGRMGRLLIPLFLMERGRLSQPLLYLSSYIESRRSDYYDLLQGVRTDGDWDSWIRFFLAGVETTAVQAVQQTKRLMDLREEYRYLIREKPKALALVDYLFVNPYVTAMRARSYLKVSDPTARAAIGVLSQAGIVTEYGDRTWRKLYVSPQILDILSNLDRRDDQRI